MQAISALLDGGAVGRSLEVQSGASIGQARGELAGLNTADFYTVGVQGKNRHAVQPAQLMEVVDVAVENDPADAGSLRGASYLGQRGTAGRARG